MAKNVSTVLTGKNLLHHKTLTKIIRLGSVINGLALEFFKESSNMHMLKHCFKIRQTLAIFNKFQIIFPKEELKISHIADSVKIESFCETDFCPRTFGDENTSQPFCKEHTLDKKLNTNRILHNAEEQDHDVAT